MLRTRRTAAAAPRCARPRAPTRSSAVRCERCERDPTGLVRQRHLHLGAAGERLEQRPLGAGQVLEAVREHRLAVPRVEVGLRAARPRGGGAGRGPRARAGRARRGRRRTAARGRRRGRPGRACPARARRASASSVSAKPPVRAERARPFSAPPASARRTTSARWASVATGRCSGSTRTSRRNRSSNVPIEPLKRQPQRASRSRSTRSTSDAFGTIRVGSSSRRAR